MSDVPSMLKRQAEWQQSRAKLSWAAKLRMAEQVRGTVLALKRGRERPQRRGEGNS